VKAVILAAGRGSRMGGLTDDRPKCLVELGGRPLIDWQVAALTQAGVGEIGIVRGYRGDRLAGYGIRHFENPRWAETNMVVSLLAAEEWLSDGPVIVSYADIVYGSGTVRALLDAKPAPIAVSYDADWLWLWRQRFSDPLSDAESFRMADGRIVDIGRRVGELREIEGQYMGLLRFEPEGWRIVRDLLQGMPATDVDRLDMTSLLRRLIAGGTVVRGEAAVGRWAEVDSVNDLRLYERLLADKELGPDWPQASTGLVQGTTPAA
jgi:choline kinase